jgi:sucrose phosphorylase
MGFEDTFFCRLESIYGAQEAKEALERLKRLLNKYEAQISVDSSRSGHHKVWSEKDAILITYGDSVTLNGTPGPKFKALIKFVDDYLGDAVSTIHILPFFPSSSDSGFAVIDYRKVREDLGDWNLIRQFAGKYRLMADLVINHTSRRSQWFKNYKKREDPGKNFFIEVNPSKDLSAVIRPRSSPLLTAVETTEGLRYLWTTFSDDQIDLDFSNPDVLFEFLDIFLFYLSQGIKVVRLDAIAYLWKQVGTSSIHLKQTHQIVKLFRDIVDYLAPDVTLITETNVPFKENISYFGEGDEAHMVYQFSLPPLLLHAILTENSRYLTDWAAELPEPPNGGMYFNFTSSHDGIGVRPLEGLVPYDEFEYLIESTKERGGFISYKENSNGTQSPYELNITYYDAFQQRGREDSELQFRRYMCSQIIMLSLQGVPGIYIHNLTATKNNIEGVIATGVRREINRKKWSYDELSERLENRNSVSYRVLSAYKDLLHKRKQHPAFDPHGLQKVYDMGNNLFAFQRSASDGSERILVISNLTRREIIVEKSLSTLVDKRTDGYYDIISGTRLAEGGSLKLGPFQTVWLRL